MGCFSFSEFPSKFFLVGVTNLAPGLALAPQDLSLHQLDDKEYSDFLVWVYFGLVRLASSFIEIEFYFYEQFTFIPILVGRREGINGDRTNNRYKPSIAKSAT